MKYKGYLLLLFLLLSAAAYSQSIRGVVVEKKLGYPVSFATITYKSSGVLKGVVSDLEGRFLVKDTNIEVLNVSCLGYKPASIEITPDLNSENLIIKLQEQSFQLRELVVTPGENPAIRIIKNVLEHKDENNYEKYKSYSYQSYLKSSFLINADPDSLKKIFAFTEDSLDNVPFMINETVTECTHRNNNTICKIIANKTTGAETPLFGMINHEMVLSMISFYNNSISIIDDEDFSNMMSLYYVNPLSNGGLSGYIYQLDNVFVQEHDSIFEISYFPKRNKNFNGLAGKMYISSNNYAISSISAKPAHKKHIHFNLKQDYEYADGRWFPSRLEQSVHFYLLGVVDTTMAAAMGNLSFKSITQIENVVYTDTITKKEKRRTQKNEYIPQLENIYVDEKLIKRSDSILVQFRPEPISQIEEKIYQFWKDSIPTTLDEAIESFSALGQSRFKIKKLDIDLSKIYGYNRYEKNQLGLGVYTNEKLIKWFSFGGYGMYGFGSKKWKYGGELDFNLSKKYDIKLRYSYDNTLKEAGKDIIDRRHFVLNTFFYNMMTARFDYVRRHSLNGYFHLLRPLRFYAAFSLNQITSLYEYQFCNKVLSNYRTEELQLSFRYAHNEKTIKLGSQRLVISTGNPIIIVNYKRGLNLFDENSLIYNKIEGSIHYNLYNGRIGQTNILLKGGFIDRSLPYGLLFTGEGSKAKWVPYMVPNTFQTMGIYEFLSDRYVHLFFEHNFGHLMINTKYFKPDIVVLQNSGWGNLKNPEDHNIDFKLQNKFYFESGLMLNKLLSVPISIFRVEAALGGFYRYGYYGNRNFKDNFALKFHLSISLM